LREVESKQQGVRVWVFSNFLWNRAGKTLWIWRGLLLVWIMLGDEISEHSITFCWVCFAEKIPAGNILYRILCVKEDERRAGIVHPA
jgi:hypothetical protein